MSLLFLNNSQDTLDLKRRIYARIKNNTGIDSGELVWYVAFCDSAGLTDNVVMYGEVKHSIEKYMLNADAILNKKNKLKPFGTYTEIINSRYSEICDIFEDKNLIDYVYTEKMTKYPRIIGYNYYNDPEFFLATRRKDELDWSGRVSSNISLKDFTLYSRNGYEFREKDAVSKFLN